MERRQTARRPVRDELVTRAELAEIMRVSLPTVDRMLREGMREAAAVSWGGGSCGSGSSMHSGGPNNTSTMMPKKRSTLDESYEPVYDESRDSGEPGVTPVRAGVRVDVQTGEMRRRSRSPVFVRVNGERSPAFRWTSAQAREIAAALNAAADLADGHAT
jgi:hypothetical protein